MAKSNDNDPNETPPPQPPDEFKDPKTPEEQYKLLKWCSDNKNLEPWNAWRNDKPGIDIDLKDAYLGSAYLNGAILWKADLNGAYLRGARLKRANLQNARLDGANLRGAHLEDANLRYAHLEGTEFWNAHLEGVRLRQAHMEGTNFTGAHLERTMFLQTHLQSASFDSSVVDGATLFTGCFIDRKTYFGLVGLDTCRIDPETKQLLEYNIRRKNWEKWYNRLWNKNLFTKIISSPLVPLRWLLVRPFWYISDYGRSTKRILLSFIALALLFATVYFCIGSA